MCVKIYRVEIQKFIGLDEISMAIQCVYQEAKRYVNCRMFVRPEPVVKCVVLGQFGYGDEVIITGRFVDDFAEVKWYDTTGWVFSSGLSVLPMYRYDIVQADDYPQMNMLDVVNAHLSMLPDYIIDVLKTNGWSILVTSKNLDDYFYKGAYAAAGGVAGVADYANKRVYIQDVVLDIQNALYHEIGHVFDYLMGFVSDSSVFLQVFELEKNQFHDSTSVGDGHEISCPREYFASVFSEMMLHPMSCQRNVPESYSFLEKSVNKFTKMS